MINHYYKKVKIKIAELITDDWAKNLAKIEKDISTIEASIPRRNIRVLLGPSFVMWAPSAALDKSISLALRLRGVDVTAMYCDSIQETECNFIGGDWGNFSRDCKVCKQRSETLWKSSPIKPVLFSNYVTESDARSISSTVSNLTNQEILKFSKARIEYGAMAKDILVNNYLVATPSLVENHEDLLRVHLKNLLLVSLAYERILDDQKPDRVVSNDSYYGMWAILEQHCKNRSIPFYSHWPVTKSRVAFAYNDAAMNLDFRKSWESFSKIELNNEDHAHIGKWIDGHRGLTIDATKLAGHEVEDPVLKIIDSQKPTMVIAANVIWDLAALNRQILFDDMIAWIVETIKWFGDNPKFQLIIRPHPAETSPAIPKTRETISEGIALRGVKLPRNVHLLKSDAKITIKDLIRKFDIRGIAVHTTTVGFEYPAQGVPVVTTARSPYRGFGFTIDPASKLDYFIEVNKLLADNKKDVSEAEKLLAKKFIKFYQFHYYSDIGLFEGNPPKLSERYSTILRQDDNPFGYVVNSIIDGLPINDESRWLPES